MPLLTALCRFMPEYAGLCRFPSEVTQYERNMFYLYTPKYSPQ
ncbi:hypothetical protein LX64_01086 [Chitinophaga skermanii]|uniref:Uncharacterized protein n=1 Tax=Chitinophaga skermanii TaxID=331697 RepID=A0A327QWV2_9BACT|nr:hypothetical protein LX64_01086 [Chitinophaga skermanii]